MKYLEAFKSHVVIKSQQVNTIDIAQVKKIKNYRARSKYAGCVLYVKSLEKDIPKLIEEYKFLKTYIKEECADDKPLDKELTREYEILFNRYSKIFATVSCLDDDWDYTEKYL